MVDQKTIRVRLPQREGAQGFRLVPGGTVEPGEEREFPASWWPTLERLGFVKVRPGKAEPAPPDAGPREGEED